ncbi:class I SAM-dependent methyltransferase [Eubacteriales bacterium OttesenSCG-928-K08]|nr:class I SAM-dependent methyltransferase [Eubacteriales bacterium OttesenSCG-928-K08]
MKNPWEEMELAHYEAHMSLQGVEQLQTLETITKEQLEAFDVTSVAILGIAGGNGLKHIPETVASIIGVDINREYLIACEARYGNMNGRLSLLCKDLSQDEAALPSVDLILANLFVEYVGIERFANLVSVNGAKYVSCAIQINTKAQFVSVSPYAKMFDGIGALHQDIDPTAFSSTLQKAGYVELRQVQYNLPNGKYLLRLDYAQYDS